MFSRNQLLKRDRFVSQHSPVVALSSDLEMCRRWCPRGMPVTPRLRVGRRRSLSSVHRNHGSRLGSGLGSRACRHLPNSDFDLGGVIFSCIGMWECKIKTYKNDPKILFCWYFYTSQIFTLCCMGSGMLNYRLPRVLSWLSSTSLV